MASQVAEGYILLNTGTIRGYAPGELSLLRFELERLQRETRAEVPAPDDAQATQARHRKISRISSAVQIVSGAMTGRR